MGALQFPQFVTEVFVSGVIAIPQFQVLGLQKPAKDSRNLYAKRSFPVALGSQIMITGALDWGYRGFEPGVQFFSQIDIHPHPVQYR